MRCNFEGAHGGRLRYRIRGKGSKRCLYVALSAASAQCMSLTPCTACSRDGTIALWDCGSAELLRAWEVSEDSSINDCCLLQATIAPPALGAGTHPADDAEVHEKEVGTSGKVVAAASEERFVALVDLRRETIAAKLSHSAAVLSVAPAGIDEHFVASGDAVGNVRVWDLRMHA